MLSITQQNEAKRLLAAQFRKMVSVLETKLLPTFESLKTETDEHYRETLSNLLKGQSSPGDSPGWAEKAAWFSAKEHYEMCSDIRQALINQQAVTLFHLFEQHVREMHHRVLKQTILSHENQILNKWSSWCRSELLTDTDQALLKEIRALAGAVKHGEGRSAEELRKLRPSLFHADWMPEFESICPSNEQYLPTVYVPLFGQEVYVKMADIHRYKDGLIQVWRTCVEGLGSIQRDPTDTN